MRTVVLARDFGGPEVLDVATAEDLSPGIGEVLIEVRAAGMNPIDFKLFSGARGRDPKNLPFNPGFEVAGVVKEVGPGANGPRGPIAEGDEVIAYQVSGGWASSITVPAANVFPKPASMDWEQGAGLMLAGVTAVHSLEAVGVAEGQTVLVHGAAGGVGLITVQLAVLRGAKVIATAGEASHDRLRELGAQPVLYGDGLVERIRQLAPDGVDSAIDNVGVPEALEASLEFISDPQKIVTIANYGAKESHGVQLTGGAPGADAGNAIRDAARLQLIDLVDAGKLKIFVDRTFPLAQAEAATRYLQEGHSHGKVLLLP